MLFLSILRETSCHVSSISDRHMSILSNMMAPLFSEFIFSATPFLCYKKKKSSRNTNAMETTIVYPAQPDFRILQFSEFPRKSKSPLTKLHCVGHIYYSWSLLSSNRIPARQRQSDSILIGCDGDGGGDRRESQFPERSRCNLRLKQRGGTTITDCIRSTERVIPGTGDAGIHRHVAVYTIHTHTHTHTDVGGTRHIGVMRARVCV